MLVSVNGTQNFEKWQRSAHEGSQMYSCNQCEYQTTRNGHLKTHIHIKHWDKYSCKQCEYQSMEPRILKSHKDQLMKVHKCIHVISVSIRQHERDILGLINKWSMGMGNKHECLNLEYQLKQPRTLRCPNEWTHTGAITMSPVNATWKYEGGGDS